jgi:hypothetical protein
MPTLKPVAATLWLIALVVVIAPLALLGHVLNVLGRAALTAANAIQKFVRLSLYDDN